MELSRYAIAASIFLLVLWMITRKHSNQHQSVSHLKSHSSRCSTTACPFRGQKSKCYSCEKQAYRMSNGNECAVFNEHPMKYYENTQIYPAMGYAKMGPVS